MPAKDTVALLRSMPVFASLPPREIESLAALAIAESHRARAGIFTEGDAARWLYVVKSGHVKIVRQSRAGKDVVLDLLGPGEIFGGVAVIERRPYPASAVASEASVVLKIPAEPMIAVAERYPAVIREMALMIGLGFGGERGAEGQHLGNMILRRQREARTRIDDIVKTQGRAAVLPVTREARELRPVRIEQREHVRYRTRPVLGKLIDPADREHGNSDRLHRDMLLTHSFPLVGRLGGGIADHQR